MEVLIPLLLQIIGAAIGGNIAGLTIKKYSLGIIGNSLLGIHGGGVGGYILSVFSINIGGTIYGSMLVGIIGGFIVAIALMVILHFTAVPLTFITKPSD